MTQVDDRIFPDDPNKLEIESLLRNLKSILNNGIQFGENFDVSIVTVTHDTGADTEVSTTHTLGRIPTGFIVYEKSVAGIIYKSDTYTTTVIKTKSDTDNVNYKVLIF